MRGREDDHEPSQVGLDDPKLLPGHGSAHRGQGRDAQDHGEDVGADAAGLKKRRSCLCVKVIGTAFFTTA